MSHQALSRDLGLFDITMIGVGAMIGAGIFVLTGEAAGIAGPALVLSFALNGVVTLFTAMVYAELGSAIPEAGGGYLWIKEGLPGSNAFLAGWMSWFAHAVAGALYALGFGAFVFELLRIFGVSLSSLGVDLVLAKKIFGLAIAVAFAFINFRGASETGLAGNIVTVAKLVVIGVFCLFGLKLMFFPEVGFSVEGVAGGMGLDQLQPFIPEETGWLGIVSAMGLTFIAFEGYEIIVQAGEEVKDPRRNIPKAIFWSLVVVIPLYMLVAFVLVGASSSAGLVDALHALGQELPEGLGPDAPSWQLLRHVGELGLARVADQFVPFGAVLILIGGLLSTMSALNATTFSSTRVSFAMGRDRNLPDSFSSVHERTHTPHVALSWTAALIGFMVAFVPITTVAAAADIMFLLLFLQVNVAVLTLRRKYGDKLAYGFIVPFFPIVPIVVIVAKLALALFMFHHYPTAWGYVVVWLVLGFAIYRFYARGREREEAAPPVLAEEHPFEVKPHSVLVALAGRGPEEQLVRLGARIAGIQESELVLLHTVTVPRQLPVSAGHRLDRRARGVLEKARELVEGEAVAVRTLVRLARRPALAIVHTAQDRHTDYLIMGWHGAIKRTGSLVGRNIDRVIKESKCNVIVLEEVEAETVETVLVPVRRPDRAPLAIGVAACLVSGAPSARITLLHLTEEELSREKKDEFREAVHRQAVLDEHPEPTALFDSMSPLSLEFETYSGSLATAIASHCGDYDRIILGTGRGRLLGRTIIGGLSREIARRVSCPVVFVRSREPEVQFEVQKFFQFFQDLEEEGKPEGERETSDRSVE